MTKSFLALQLVLAVFMLVLLSGPAHASNSYIEGLSIQLEDYPSKIRVGETFTMTVRVVNQSGQPMEGLLRTYLYGYTSEIAYPSADFYDVILLNEGGGYPNETSVSLGDNEDKLFTLSLTVKSEIQLVSDSGALAKLRTCISRVENGANINLAPPDNRYITLLPKAGPEGIIAVKLGVGVAIVAAIVYSVATVQNHTNRSTRKRARR